MSAIASPLRPLSPIEINLYPLLKRFKRGNAREMLRLRGIATMRVKAQKAAQAKLAKELEHEAKEYEQMMVTCLTRLGFAWTPHREHEASKGRKGKVQHVRFEMCKTSAEIIYFKVATRKKTLFGFKNALPYKVWVSDLISDDTLRDLSYATERVVTAVYADPRKGVWYRVHRLEGVGGLPTRVAFRDMLDHYPKDMGKANVILGVGEHRKVHSFDLAKHPHLLIGGPTGGGKSNMVNTIIASQMRLQNPETFKFVLIDLKRMEFNFFEDAPHLYCPVIFEPDAAIQKLTELMDEVKRRSDLLNKAKAKELAAWNTRFPDQRMPRIVVVIDEFAELMLASGDKVAKQTETLVSRITNLGRAVGIHLIICTQRPAVSVVSGAIRTNMAVTVCGKTPNKTQSQVIIGVGDAATLPDIPGRMIYGLGSHITPIQTPLIDDDDVIQAVKIARGKAAGVIRLEGTEPVVVPEGLALFAVKHSSGSLAGADIAEKLAQHAVTFAMYKNAVDELVQHNTLETPDGKVYAIEPGERGYRVRLVAQWEGEAEPVLESEPLAIPAQVPSSQTVEDTQPAPAVVIDVEAKPVTTAPISVSELVEQFITERCTVKPGVKCRAKTLYGAFREWAAENGAGEITQQAFGNEIAARGFEAGKAKGIVWRKGITVEPTQSTPAADPLRGNTLEKVA